jgi:hypothetical protein
MNKKHRKKLSLNREVLRTLDPANLKEAAGGIQTTSDNCTVLCTHPPGSDGGQSYCHCPFCQSLPVENPAAERWPWRRGSAAPRQPIGRSQAGSWISTSVVMAIAWWSER